MQWKLRKSTDRVLDECCASISNIVIAECARAFAFALAPDETDYRHFDVDEMRFGADATLKRQSEGTR